MELLFVGIDLGTQGIRIGVIDSHGNIVSSKTANYSTKYIDGKYIEQDPNSWIEAFENIFSDILNDLGERKKDISTITVCATSSTVLSVDENGRAISNAIMWMDNRNTEECEFINNMSDEVLQYCGNNVSSEWIVPKSLWLKKHNNELFRKSYKIVEQLDFFNYYITNKWASSLCNATCKANYIESKGGWQDKFFKKIGLEEYREKFATDVLKVGSEIGNISEYIVQKFGLNSNVKVLMGSIDAHMGMIGSGVVEPGKICTITGSSLVHLFLTEKPYFSNSLWGPYNNAMIDGYWLLEAGQISAASIIEWFKNEFYKNDDKNKNPYDALSEGASQISPGCDGLICLDFFQGNRTPYKDVFAKGVFYGITLNHKQSHFYRSILESIGYAMKNTFISIESLGIDINEVILSGGATKDNLWLQILSDITGKKMIINKNNLTGVLGCAVCGAVFNKVYKNYSEAVENMVHKEREIIPNNDYSKIYNMTFNKYVDLYDSLKNMMRNK